MTYVVRYTLLAPEGIANVLLQRKPQASVVAVNGGPGTELKKLIARFGFHPMAGCKCAQHIREMDLKGVQWCRDNVDTVVDWLRIEAIRAGYPFTAIGAKILIKRAIAKAGRSKI